MPRTLAAAAPTALVKPLVLVALALSLLPLMAAAQDSTTAVPTTPSVAPTKSKGIARSGFFFSVGIGGGQERFEEDLGPNATNKFTSDGASVALRLGGAVSPKLLLGADFFGFAPDRGSNDDGTGGFFATATFFPKAGGGLLFRGGLGQLRTEVGSSGLVLTNTVGALQLGAGYDVRIGRNKAIGISLDVLQSAKEDGVSQRLALLGVSFNVY